MSTDALLAIAAALLGAILGSFLNALSFRYNTGRSMGGRSQCARCGEVLHARDLVPILSYVFLRGQCRFCGTRISLQYPLVEATGALLALLVYASHPEPLAFGFWLLVWLSILFIVVYDVRHKIIPWSSNLVLLGLSLTSLVVSFVPLDVALPRGEALAAGPILAGPFLVLFLISRGRWLGFGDIPLMMSFGWLLGLAAGFSALLLGVWTGALVGIVLMALRTRVTLKSEVPFAPFLAFGAFLAYFFNVDAIQLLSGLWL